jgi:PAT family beta-lactamase induction signal transducer AmpG
VARETIGYASLIGLAYAFKWVWSPLLDQWRLPLLGKLGRRRSWLVLVAIAGDPRPDRHGLLRPAETPVLADRHCRHRRLCLRHPRHRGRRLSPGNRRRQPPGRPGRQLHVRLPIAALLATAGALFFAEGFGSTGFNYQHSAWTGTYVLFGVLMIPALLTTLFMREPPVPLRTQLQAGRYSFVHQLASVFVLIVLLVSVPAMFTQLYNTDFASVLFQGRACSTCCSKTAPSCAPSSISPSPLCLSTMGRRGLAPVLTPVNDFILRYRWQALLLLGLIATYRMSDTVMGVMANVFYIDQGFTKDQIASVSKIFGLIMTLVGAGMGGLLIVRFGILPILFIGGGIGGDQPAVRDAGRHGPNLQMLIVTISWTTSAPAWPPRRSSPTCRA